MSRAPGKANEVLLNLVLFAVVFLVCALLAEAGLRLLWHNPYRYEHPDHILKLPIHHPNTYYRVDRILIKGEPRVIHFRTDDRGYVVPSRQFTDPERTILFLGGSTTECFAVQEKLRFPSLVSELFQSHQGKKISTLNMGRSGNTVHDCLNILLNYAVLDKPDAAVLMEASNDYGILENDPTYRTRMGSEMGPMTGFRWFMQKASTELFLVGRIRYFVNHVSTQPDLKRTMSQEVISPTPFRARLESFVGLCRAFGIQPFLMTQPMADFTTPLTPSWQQRTTQSRFNEVILDVGRVRQVSVIDLDAILREKEPGFQQPMKVFYDGVHVTDYGSQVYAAVIYEALSTWIALPK